MTVHFRPLDRVLLWALLCVVASVLTAVWWLAGLAPWVVLAVIVLVRQVKERR